MTHVLRPQTRWYLWVQSIGLFFLLVPTSILLLRFIPDAPETQMPSSLLLIIGVVLIPLGLLLLFVRILDRKGTITLDETGIHFHSIFLREYHGKNILWHNIEEIKLSHGYVVGRYSGGISAKARGQHLAIKMSLVGSHRSGMPRAIRLSFDYLPPVEEVYALLQKYPAPLNRESFTQFKDLSMKIGMGY